MILVPNHRQRLSGSKTFLIVFSALILLFAACSKRVAPVKPESVPPVRPERETVQVPERKKTDHSIALLLPFELQKFDLKTATQQSIQKAELAIDFYQGMKLALDSLAKRGHNFELKVFDTEERETKIVNLARAASVRDNDIIIGPIFPESIETFSSFAELEGKLQVSPLAAAMPKQFQNANLVTVTNSIDIHGWKVADYITRNYKPEQVNIVLINTRSSDDEKFSAPVRNYIKQLSNGRFKIVERPNAIGLQTHLTDSKRNLVIIAPTDKDFVQPTIDKLYSLTKQDYRIEVFGHPNWVRLSFLDAAKLQGLDTRITSSYHINYQSQPVKNFVARYRDEYGLEPSEFAFKGFDTGYYFGSLLERFGDKYPENMEGLYRGLHNNFRFRKDPVSGYQNIELHLLQYRGFELVVVK